MRIQMRRRKPVPLLLLFAVLAIMPGATVLRAQETQRQRLDQIQQSLKPDVPRLMCLDDHFAPVVSR